LVPAASEKFSLNLCQEKFVFTAFLYLIILIYQINLYPTHYCRKIKSLDGQCDRVYPGGAITVNITAINIWKRVFLQFLKKIAFFSDCNAYMRFSGKGIRRSLSPYPRPGQAQCGTLPHSFSGK
jgi:hypothetical protein